MPQLETAPALLSRPADAIRLLRWSKVVALDLETTGLNPRTDRIRLLSLASEQESCVVDCFEHDIRQILPWMSGKLLIAHHAAFDLGFLWQAGLTDLPETVCTYLLAQLCTAGQGEGNHGFPRLGLGACCLDLLGLTLDKELQSSNWSGPLTDAQVTYARKDAEVLLSLFRALNKRLDALGLVKVSDVELRALPAFVWLAQSGVPFDQPAWEGLARSAEQRKAELEEQLNRQAPYQGPADLFGDRPQWNWGSPQQVAEALSQLGLHVDTTNDAQLALLDHPVADLLRRQRTEAQLVKMYGTNWLNGASIAGGRVYPSWRQIGAASGRTAGANPNMQQIPRNVAYRNCVRASPGCTLIKADYATLQMRIAAKWARDKVLLQVFRENGDPHTATARILLGKQDVTKADRQIAKSANFGLLFGMSAPGLRVYARMTYGIQFTADEAEQHRAKFFDTYWGLARWHRETKAAHCTETRGASGRRRALPAHAPDTWRLNSPVQADEADGLKLSLALLWERRAKCPSAKPVLAVHDEIVVEVPTDDAEPAKMWLTTAMEDGMRPWLDPVPVRVDADLKLSWGA